LGLEQVEHRPFAGFQGEFEYGAIVALLTIKIHAIGAAI
jgi:hypothetical protein